MDMVKIQKKSDEILALLKSLLVFNQFINDLSCY